MNGFTSNPLLNIGLGILGANGPGVSAGQAIGRGGMLGLNNFANLKMQEERAKFRQLQAEAMMAEMARAKKEAERQAELNERARQRASEDPSLGMAYDLGGTEGAMELFMAQKAAELKDRNKVYQLSPGGILVGPGGDVLQKAPFRPQAEGSTPEFERIMGHLRQMAPDDPDREFFEARAKFLAGMKKRGSTSSPGAAVNLSAKERANAREALENARVSKQLIERALAKVDATGEALVGARGQVQQFTEGALSNIMGVGGENAPASSLANDIGMLRSRMRVPMIGPGNPSTAEWQMLEKRISGDDFMSSAATTRSSLKNLYEYLDQIEEYNSNLLQGESAPVSATSDDQYSQEDLEYTAKKHGLSVDEVKRMLREGRRPGQ